MEQPAPTCLKRHTVEEKRRARRQLITPGGQLHAKLTIIERLLCPSTTKYYLGDTPGMADVLILCCIANIGGGYVIFISGLSGEKSL